MRNKIAGLYAIADTRYLDDSRLISAARAAIDGGARIIQYRDKDNDVIVRERQAHSLAVLCRQADVVFLVNDDVMLTKKVNADGVHLGRDDMSVATARAILGSRVIVGVSCYNELARAQRAQHDGADYVAFGSFFASHTKPRAVRAPLELLREAHTALGVPIVAIGGITPKNAAALLHAGADALAVVEGIFGADDARAAAADYTRLFG